MKIEKTKIEKLDMEKRDLLKETVQDDPKSILRLLNTLKKIDSDVFNITRTSQFHNVYSNGLYVLQDESPTRQILINYLSNCLFIAKIELLLVKKQYLEALKFLLVVRDGKAFPYAANYVDENIDFFNLDDIENTSINIFEKLSELIATSRSNRKQLIQFTKLNTGPNYIELFRLLDKTEPNTYMFDDIEPMLFENVGNKQLGLNTLHYKLQIALERIYVKEKRDYREKIKVPLSYGLDIEFYNDFMRHSNLMDRIQKKIDSINWQVSEEDLNAELSTIYIQIKQSFLRSFFSEKQTEKIKRIYICLNARAVTYESPGVTVMVRSSSPFEDCEVTAAGRYFSKGGNYCLEDVMKSIKEVYASAFSPEALLFHYNQNGKIPDAKEIVMCIIFQRTKTAKSSGVVDITPKYPGHEGEVSNAAGLFGGTENTNTNYYRFAFTERNNIENIVQMLYPQQNKKVIIPIRPEQGIQKMLISEDEQIKIKIAYEDLHKLMESMVYLYNELMDDPRLALNIEYTLNSDNTISIVQARTFTPEKNFKITNIVLREVETPYRIDISREILSQGAGSGDIIILKNSSDLFDPNLNIGGKIIVADHLDEEDLLLLFKQTENIPSGIFLERCSKTSHITKALTVLKEKKNIFVPLVHLDGARHIFASFRNKKINVIATRDIVTCYLYSTEDMNIFRNHEKIHAYIKETTDTKEIKYVKPIIAFNADKLKEFINSHFEIHDKHNLGDTKIIASLMFYKSTLEKDLTTQFEKMVTNVDENNFTSIWNDLTRVMYEKDFELEIRDSLCRYIAKDDRESLLVIAKKINDIYLLLDSIEDAKMKNYMDLLRFYGFAKKNGKYNLKRIATESRIFNYNPKNGEFKDALIDEELIGHRSLADHFKNTNKSDLTRGIIISPTNIKKELRLGLLDNKTYKTREEQLKALSSTAKFLRKIRINPNFSVTIMPGDLHKDIPQKIPLHELADIYR